ncbi:hypothetical protein [Nonomuraea antri]|uniref:hypothetical protein n=1 Tax=Nonomuraea antri TaxID=2730852 RepID=UPI001F3FCB08|nr:hypothetical protein [Nonomuraea antri]
MSLSGLDRRAAITTARWAALHARPITECPYDSAGATARERALGVLWLRIYRSYCCQENSRHPRMGFIRSVLPQPVLDFLGIHSPSRLFAKIGRQVPAGLALGITAAGGLVRTAVQRMAGIVAGAAIPDVPTPGFALPSGGLGSRVVVHQTNYYPQAEPTSATVNHGLQLAGALGVI